MVRAKYSQQCFKRNALDISTLALQKVIILGPIQKFETVPILITFDEIMLQKVVIFGFSANSEKRSAPPVTKVAQNVCRRFFSK